MHEIDYIGKKFAKYGQKNTSGPNSAVVAVGASFRAVEQELGRKLKPREAQI